MALTTRHTQYFGIQHPIVLAPMTPAAGEAVALNNDLPSAGAIVHRTTAEAETCRSNAIISADAMQP